MLYRIAVVSRATRRVISVAISIDGSCAGLNAMVPGNTALLVTGGGGARFGPCVSPASATADIDTTSALVAKNRASFDILMVPSFRAGSLEKWLPSDRRSGLITGIIALLAIILAS